MAEKKLDISGYFDADWVCRFFFQSRASTTGISVGSCLSSGIPLGTVGEIDLAFDGNFTITIPDFARDPVLANFVERGKFGVIQLAFREKKIGHALATITGKDAPELGGLNVQAEYPDPVVFTRFR